MGFCLSFGDSWDVSDGKFCCSLGSSWHQVDVQQRQQQLGVLGGAAGAADPRQPPDQTAASDTQLSLHWYLG